MAAPSADLSLIRDRAVGSLLGLAVGDAVGTTLEFARRDAEPPLTDMVGGGPFQLVPGEWTDDTSMALCLADSLIACADLDERDLMDRFSGWRDHGVNSVNGTVFDIGSTTDAAIARYARTGNPRAGSTDPRSAGNGSLMRLAPVAIRWSRRPAKAADAARVQSATTHGAPAALDACAYFAELLIGAFEHGDKSVVLTPSSFAGDPEIARIAAGSWRGKNRAAIRSSGYVVHTLEAALWAVDGAAGFEDAILRAANLGASAIPPHWLARLKWREQIERRALTLFEKSLAD